MKQQLGTFLQFVTLVFLPLLMLWQLNWGLHIIWMPIGLVVGVVLFTIGNKLRES